jgi:hypothetical protein
MRIPPGSRNAVVRDDSLLLRFGWCRGRRATRLVTGSHQLNVVEASEFVRGSRGEFEFDIESPISSNEAVWNFHNNLMTLIHIYPESKIRWRPVASGRVLNIGKPIFEIPFVKFFVVTTKRNLQSVVEGDIQDISILIASLSCFPVIDLI